jgi:hypothetical protein
LLDLTPFRAASGGSPSPSPIWRGERPAVGFGRPKVRGEVKALIFLKKFI